MKCKILELNSLDALVSLEDGTAFDISVTKLPENIRSGDIIDIPFSPYSDFESHNLKKNSILNNNTLDLL
ncbi:hypothetical protein [Clostridium fallax]|uniref:DUF3006 domain-containing protein n=1 Tax=Clostridium fallax TaxID=1533 RepID=A0A1M4TBX0_9CLOT|nr:hypothetical protein [Clostridium fallax]SHE41874.1 hypothetical protein SAMN05443638_102114 [Clostridium fallax]SQB22689.1 Uncharacterised protein [Clostridium fallax]